MIIKYTSDLRAAINMGDMVVRGTVTQDDRQYYVVEDLANQTTNHIACNDEFDGITLRSHVEFFSLIKA